MKPLLAFVVFCFLAAAAPVRADNLSPEDQYFNIYTMILKGDALADTGKTAPASAQTKYYDAAKTNYNEAVVELKKLQEDFPTWNVKVIKYRLTYLAARLEELSGPAPRKGGPRASTTAQVIDEAIAPANPDELVDFKFKWQVGKRYVQRLSLVLGTDISGAGPSPVSIKGDLTQDLSISVLKERDGGGQELELKLMDTKVNVKQGTTTLFSFDSKHPAADNPGDPVGPALKRLAGAHVTLLTGANGQVESMDGGENFLKTVMGSDFGDPADLMKSIPADMSTNLKGAMGMKALPANPVKIGDTWGEPTEVNDGPGIDIVQSVKYTFTGWANHSGHKCAIIEFAGDVAPKGAEGGPVDFKITYTGKMWFDPALGMLIESATKPAITFKTSATGQAISAKASLTFGTKLVELADLAIQ